MKENKKDNKTKYTSPKNEKEIRDYLKNLEVFINNNSDDIDPLIKV